MTHMEIRTDWGCHRRADGIDQDVADKDGGDDNQTQDSTDMIYLCNT